MLQDNQPHNQPQIVYFTLPKIGEGEADIQDACFWSEKADPMRVAIADGVSTSLWPREWADLLVHQLCNDKKSISDIIDKWEEWLKPIQEKWRQFYLQQQQNQNLPWYAKGSKEKNYGGATFVGLHILPPSSEGQQRWEAIAVGDSCLFHIPAKTQKIKQAFPLEKPEHFSTVTHAVPSLSDYKPARPDKTDNTWAEGDIFLLATDALAEFLLKQKNRPEILQKFIDVASQKDFADLISKFRHDRLIKNDDTTLCRILVSAKTPNIPPPPSLNLVGSPTRNLVGSSVAPSPQSVPTPVGAAAPNWQPAGGNAQRQLETSGGKQSKPETTETSRDNSTPTAPPASPPPGQTNPPVENPPLETPSAPSPEVKSSPFRIGEGWKGLFQPKQKTIFLAVLAVVAIAAGAVFQHLGALEWLNNIMSRIVSPSLPPAAQNPFYKSPAGPSPIQPPTTSSAFVDKTGATAAPPATTAPPSVETTQPQTAALSTPAANQNNPAQTTQNSSTATSSTPQPSKQKNNPADLVVPIYLASGNSNQSSGYLWKTSATPTPGSGEILLWVHIPNSYLTQVNTGANSVLTIPNGSTPLVLYVNKQTPQDLSPEDFAGYLLPGTYQVSQLQGSSTFDEASWVKVSVKLLQQKGVNR